MKKEDMYNAISDIDADILSDVDAYVDSRKTKKTIHWKRWSVVAACLFLALCVYGVCKMGGDSPFVVTAYAMDAEGETVGTQFAVGREIQMAEIELSTRKSCYLFSVDLSDRNSKSQIRAFALSDINAAEEQEIVHRCVAEKGKSYFYFVPKEMTEEGFGIAIPLNDTGKKESDVEYVLHIRYENGGFYAQLVCEG